MTRMVASLSALILSILFLVSGNAFLTTLLGIRLSIEEVDPGTIGWILVCFSIGFVIGTLYVNSCLLYTSPSPRDRQKSRMPSSA